MKDLMVAGRLLPLVQACWGIRARGCLGTGWPPGSGALRLYFQRL